MRTQGITYEKAQLEEIYKMMNSASITVKKRNNILTQ